MEQYLKIFVLSKVLNFILLVPAVVSDLQTGHLKDRYHAQIILLLFTMKFFYIFFWFLYDSGLRLERVNLKP